MFRLVGAFEATRNRTYSDRGTKSMVDMPPVWHAAKKWKRRASERLFAPRDYNGYGKAGLNPLEWAYEWSPFSVIIGALSTAQCRARNWHAKIGCDPIVGYCPIPSYRRTVAPPPFLRVASVFEYFVVSILSIPASSIDLRGLAGEKNFPTSTVNLECTHAYGRRKNAIVES